MKIALVTDAWHPQVNGVVRTLDAVTGILRKWGHDVLVISPDEYRSFPAPTYPEIRLGMTRARTIGRRISAFGPDAIHLATEGPLCISARRWCRRNNANFTTAYHTQFPEYLAKRTGLSPRVFWAFIRWFHSASQAVMVSTQSVSNQLRSERLTQVHHWSRGVDLAHFSSTAPVPELFAHLPRPIQLYVGRVAVEKNLEAFLSADHPGSKVVVGDGPAFEELRRRYPQAHFAGRKTGPELAGYYAGADVFVFPSKTDTFGLVLIEALASGTPVAAYPVTGPVDILTDQTGCMADHLEDAIAGALPLDRKQCVALAKRYSWEASARQFLDGLVPTDPRPAAHLTGRVLTQDMLARA